MWNYIVWNDITSPDGLKRKYTDWRLRIYLGQKWIRHYFVNKSSSSQGYGFPVVMYGRESWTIKKAEHRRIDAFELWCRRTLESPLDCKEIQPTHPKENQSWTFNGRTDVEAETPILWPPDANGHLSNDWLIWKDPDTGKDWGQEEKGMTEDEMVWWHDWLDRHEFE